MFQYWDTPLFKTNPCVSGDKDWKVGEPVEIAVNITEAGPGQLGINLSAPPGSGTDCHAKEVR